MRICINYESLESYDNKWYRYNDGFLCMKCRNRLISNPKWNPSRSPIYDQRRLTWTPTGKRISLKDPIRKGICLKCGKQGYTQLHHIKYHEDDPLKDTIELCVPCHNRESWRLGCYKNNIRDPTTGRFIKNY